MYDSGVKYLNKMNSINQFKQSKEATLESH